MNEMTQVRPSAQATTPTPDPLAAMLQGIQAFKEVSATLDDVATSPDDAVFYLQVEHGTAEPYPLTLSRDVLVRALRETRREVLARLPAGVAAGIARVSGVLDETAKPDPAVVEPAAEGKIRWRTLKEMHAVEAMAPGTQLSFRIPPNRTPQSYAGSLSGAVSNFIARNPTRNYKTKLVGNEVFVFRLPDVVAR